MQLRAQLKRPTEHLRRIDKRIAMHHAISSKLGILKTGDHAEYALLLGKREVGLEADQIEALSVGIFGTQLNHRPRAATRCRIGEANRLHGPKRGASNPRRAISSMG